MLILLIASVVWNVNQEREGINVLGSRQLLNLFYFIDRAFYNQEPDMPQDSSDGAVTFSPLCLSLKRIINVPRVSNLKKVWHKFLYMSHYIHIHELHISERY